MPLPGGLRGEAGHAPRALVLRAAAGVGGRGLPGSAPACRPAPGSCGSGCSGRCGTVCWTTPVPLEDVVELQPVRPQGLLPHEDEDLHPPGVAELEGLDVVEVHGEVHSSVGQSGLPARGAASSAAGQQEPEQLVAFDRLLVEPFDSETVGKDAPHEAAVVLVGSRWPSSWPGSRAAPSSSLPPCWAAGARAC